MPRDGPICENRRGHYRVKTIRLQQSGTEAMQLRSRGHRCSGEADGAALQAPSVGGSSIVSQPD
jgi:hypothetical protein